MRKSKYVMERYHYNEKTGKYTLKNKASAFPLDTSYDGFVKNKALDERDGYSGVRIKTIKNDKGHIEVSRYSAINKKLHDKVVVRLRKPGEK